jgi:hypothetical protein
MRQIPVFSSFLFLSVFLCFVILFLPSVISLSRDNAKFREFARWNCFRHEATASRVWMMLLTMLAFPSSETSTNGLCLCSYRLLEAIGSRPAASILGQVSRAYRFVFSINILSFWYPTIRAQPAHRSFVL